MLKNSRFYEPPLVEVIGMEACSPILSGSDETGAVYPQPGYNLGDDSDY